MNQSELELIKRIVDRDVEMRDLKDLMKVKSYIDKRIYAQSLRDKKEKEKEKEIELESGPAYASYQKAGSILQRGLLEFVKENLDSKTLTASKYRHIAMGAAHILDLDYRSLRVCDILGIDKEMLLDERNVGPGGLALIEGLLNQYGLSLDTELSSEEKELLGIPNGRVMTSRIERLHRYNR